MSSRTLEVTDGGRPRSVSFDEMLAFHDGNSPGGVAHAFKALERAIGLLSPDAPPEREAISVRTAFGGPGARDGIACATGRPPAVDPELARPELGATREGFVFEVRLHGRRATLAVRDGIVTDEFIALARTDPRSEDEERRLDVLKKEMTDRVMALPAEEVYDADPMGPSPLAEAVGGPLGVAETSLPAVAFVVAYTLSDQNTDVAAVVAVGLALVLSAIRLARRETPRHALSGLVGVAFAAFIATRSGRAEDFFLPGLLLNAAYATGFLISLAVRRPLVGLIVGQLDNDGRDWRADPRRMRAFTQATWLWAGLFGARLVVQLPLYLAGDVVALGVARTAMGVPLFVLGFWLTYRLVRRPA